MAPNWLSHIQVAGQLAGIALCCYPVGLVNRGAPWWLLLCLAGTTFGLWALFHNPIGNFGIYPEPKPRMRLVTSGPYRLVRHPMYGALTIMMIGVVGYNGHPLNLLGLALVVMAVVSKSIREERLLSSRFPEYPGYIQSTRRFIPFVY